VAEEEIEGMQDLLDDLEELTLVEGQQILSKSLKNASTILAEEQQHLAPVKSGKLSNNIKYKITEKSATECFSRIGPTRRVFYAMFPNFGTKYIRGDHFIERAWDNKKDEVWATIRYELGKFIDKALKKHNV
jgi:HK97 gp10 family phage protein